MSTIYIVRLRALLSLVNKTTNLSVQLAIQTATTDTNAANSPVGIGGTVTTVGRTLQDVDVSSPGAGDVNSHMWFRLGVLAKSSGATAENGTVALQASFRT